MTAGGCIERRYCRRATCPGSAIYIICRGVQRQNADEPKSVKLTAFVTPPSNSFRALSRPHDKGILNGNDTSV
jgi:hypothetical protein